MVLRVCITILLSLVLVIPVDATSETTLSYVVDSDVSPADEALIREHVESARTYAAEVFGTTDMGLVEITIKGEQRSTDQYTAMAGPGFIFFQTGSSLWVSNGALRQVQCSYHEWFHVVQHYLADSRAMQLDAPIWIVEGTAEYVGFQAMVDQELMTNEEAYLLAWESFIYGSPAEDLEAYETDDTFYRGGAGYSLSYLAIDMLMRDHVITSLGTFFEELADDGLWEDAFETAFGMPVDEFYLAFAEERDRLG